MNAKKKFVLIISLLCIVFVAATVTLVAVLAARLQTSKAVIKVKYEAAKVSAEITAKYMIDGELDEEGNQIIHDMYVEKDGEIDKTQTLLVFGPGQNDSGVLVPEDETLKLTRNNKEIIFEFYIKNLSDSIGIAAKTLDLPVKGAEGDDVDNVKITKYYINDIADSLLYTPDIIRSKDDTLLPGGVLVSILPNSTFRMYIVVTIDNLLYNASYAGNIVWSLERAVNDSV